MKTLTHEILCGSGTGEGETEKDSKKDRDTEEKQRERQRKTRRGRIINQVNELTTLASNELKMLATEETSNQNKQINNKQNQMMK